MKYLLVQPDGSIFASGDASPQGAPATARQVAARTGQDLALYTLDACHDRIRSDLVDVDLATGAIVLKPGVIPPPGGLPYLGALFQRAPDPGV